MTAPLNPCENMATDPVLHPADAPEFAARRVLYRTVAAGIVAVLAVVSIGFGLIVTFALNGVALVGNRLIIAGIPAPTLLAFLLTPLAVAWAFARGRSRLAAAARLANREHPEVAGEEARRERLFEAVGAGLFGTLSVLIGAGFVLAIAYHLTSSPGLLVCIGLVAAAMLMTYPTGPRVRAAYDRAARLSPRD